MALTLLGILTASALAVGTQAVGAAKSTAKSMAQETTVWITRPDGSLLCDAQIEGATADPVAKAKAQLEKKGVKILEAGKRNDGQMRAQACGIATGNETTFRIPTQDLAKAKSLGFEALAQ